MVQKFPQGQSNAEDLCQRVTYVYGTNAATYSYNRLASVSATGGSGCAGYSGTAVPGYTETFTYTSPGDVATKTVGFSGAGGTGSATVSYSYNTAGQVSTVSYPVTTMDPHWSWGGCDYNDNCWYPNQGVPYVMTYGFDSMGRPNSLTDNYWTSVPGTDENYYQYFDWTNFSAKTTWVKSVQYDLASRMSSLQYLTALSDNGNGVVTDTYTTETKSYNTNGQLASLGFSGGVTGSIQYNYSSTQNNGQITQAVDTISGETISYQYDQLKRLTSASSAPNTGSPVSAWNEAFQYDGFGNLTGKTLNGTLGAIPVNAATNQLANAYYDLNGNMTSGAGATLTYDESNRLTSAAEVSGGIEYYSYSPDNKQVWRQLPNGNAEYTVYGAHGEKLGVFAMVYSTAYANYSLTPIRSNIYFAGKMIWSDNVPAYQDRLGTNRANGARFYPFGDEITSTSNDREKFATYTRDAYTGLDYADQRYFASTYGRFNTADPSPRSAQPDDPGTWNRYAYVGGDPINLNDPSGLDDGEGANSSGCYFNGSWISGCDIAIGATPFAPITAFSRATQRLGAAVDALEDRSNVSPNCQKDLDALSQASGQDISLGSIQAALANTDFKNGVGSTSPVSALGGPGAEAFGAALQSQEDLLYGPGQTIGNEFARNPNGLTASTVLLGSTIFINPTLISGNLTSNEGLLFHEALHELGMIDTGIQSALGITVDGKNTKNITTKLQKDCITGKGNN